MSGILSTESNSIQSFKLYPNPVESELYVEMENLTEVQAVHIFDAKGRQSITAQNTTNMDVFGLSLGVYFVELRMSLKKTRKIIKK